MVDRLLVPVMPFNYSRRARYRGMAHRSPRSTTTYYSNSPLLPSSPGTLPVVVDAADDVRRGREVDDRNRQSKAYGRLLGPRRLLGCGGVISVCAWRIPGAV